MEAVAGMNPAGAGEQPKQGLQALAEPASAASQHAGRKRRRVQSSRAAAQCDVGMSAAEQRMLQVAMDRSKLDKSRVREVDIPEAPCFTPTAEEWRDPMKYIRSISEAGYKYGIVRIVPPEGWNPPCGLSTDVMSRKFSTRRQAVHSLQQGLPFPDGRNYTLLEYMAMANRFKETHFPHLLPSRAVPPAASKGDCVGVGGQPSTSPSQAASGAGQSSSSSSPGGIPVRTPPFASRPLPVSKVAMMAARVEQEYWDIVETGKTELCVEYGNDQDTRIYGSGFPLPSSRGEFTPPSELPVDLSSPDYYKNTGWNINNMPYLQGSPIRHIHEETAGINVPWLYSGMIFASFAFHLEDQYFYSVNYMFHGEGKQWYGIAPDDYKLFQETMRQFVHERMEEHPDLLHHMTTVIPPSILKAAGVRVCKLLQEPGQFVITFPQAYHGGFSHGFNVAEACNFALPDWLPYGRQSVLDYSVSRGARPVCVSLEELVIKMAMHHMEYEPDTCRRVANELRRIIREESRQREAFTRTTGGAGRAVELKGHEPRYDCVVTKKMCYLSAVVCYSKACRLEAQRQRMACHARRKERLLELQEMGIEEAPVDEEEEQRVAKPRHMDELCPCDARHKILVFWHRLDFLEDLLTKVETRGELQAAEQRRPCLRLDKPAAVARGWSEDTPERTPARREAGAAGGASESSESASTDSGAEQETNRAGTGEASQKRARVDKEDSVRVGSVASGPVGDGSSAGSGLLL